MRMPFSQVTKPKIKNKELIITIGKKYDLFAVDEVTVFLFIRIKFFSRIKLMINPDKNE